MNPNPPLYSERCPGLLLPNARACANGDAAALFTLPLTRNPSAACRSRFGIGHRRQVQLRPLSSAPWRTRRRALAC